MAVMRSIRIERCRALNRPFCGVAIRVCSVRLSRNRTRIRTPSRLDYVKGREATFVAPISGAPGPLGRGPAGGGGGILRVSALRNCHCPRSRWPLDPRERAPRRAESDGRHLRTAATRAARPETRCA